MLNSNTLEGRKTLTTMVLRLFDLWELSLKEQAQLLGYSPNSHNTIRRLRNGGILVNKQRVLERAETLIVIHKFLRMIFPYNRKLAYLWISQVSKGFVDRRPLDVILESEDGLFVIRKHLALVFSQ